MVEAERNTFSPPVLCEFETLQQKKIEVYDTPSNLGASFTVSIEKVLGDTVEVRVW